MQKIETLSAEKSIVQLKKRKEKDFNYITSGRISCTIIDVQCINT